VTTERSFTRDGRLDCDALVRELCRFLDLVLRTTQLDLRYDVRLQEPAADPGAESERPEVLVAFDGRDRDLLLDRNADLLMAIEYIAHRWLRLEPQFYDHVQIDCANYRAVRLDELKMSARLAAERVRDTKTPFRFNPMSPRERRVVHIALKDFPGVRTASEGMGDRRQVVILPA